MKKLILAALVAMVASCAPQKFEYDAAGNFEATEVIVSAEGNGKIMRLDAYQGDMLKAGAAVGYIDTTQLDLKRTQLTLAAKASKSRLQDIEKQIAGLKEQISAQKREMERTQKLLKSDAATQKQYDDYKSSVAVLESQLVAQQSTLERNNRGISDEVAAYGIEIDQIRDMIVKSIITSPIDGTLLEKYAQYGEYASIGKPLFKMADVVNMELKAYVTSSQLESIKLGQQVKVFADYGTQSSREYSGEIIWISDKAEFTPKNIQTKDERANLVYAIKVAVKSDGYIKIGMYGVINF